MKRRLFAAFLVLPALAAAGCGGSSDSSTSSAAAPRAGSGAYVLGRWHGALHQKQLPPFAVSVDIGSLADSRKNRVAYSLLRCGGNWTYQGFGRGAYHFRELIDRGAGGSCKGVGHVTLVPKGRDQVRYEFRGGGVVSRGTLHRAS